MLLLANKHTPNNSAMQEVLGSIGSELLVIPDFETFKQTVLQQTWDVLVSAFEFQNGNCFDVVNVIKDSERHLPFVVVGDRVSGAEVARLMAMSPVYRYLEASDLKQLPLLIEQLQNQAKQYAHFDSSTKASLQQEISQQQIITTLQAQLEQSEKSTTHPALSGLLKSVGIFSCGAEGRQILEANDVFLKMLGYTQKDLLAGKLNWQVLTGEEQLPSIKTDFHQNPQKETTELHEQSLRHQDGHWISASIGTAFWDMAQQICTCFVLERPTKSSLEKQFTYLLHALNDNFIGIHRWHLDGRILDANQTFLNMLGYSRDELNQGLLNWRDITPPEYQTLDNHAAQLITEQGEAPAFEKQYLHKNGSRVDVLLGRLYCEADNPEVGNAFILDISQMKRNERALGEVQGNLLNAQRIAKIGSWDCDLVSLEMYYSEEFYRIVGAPLGTSFDTMEKFLPYVHPEDRERWAQVIQKALANEDLYAIDYRVVRPDGTVRQVRAQGEVIFDAQGLPIHMHGTLQDVTESHQVQQTLMLLTNQQEALLNNIPDMAWMKDRDLRYIAVNESKAKLLGTEKESIIGKKYEEFALLPECAERAKNAERQVLETGKRIIVETSLIFPDGKKLWLEVINSPIFNHECEVIGITGIARDITQRKEYEEAIMRANELLEKKVTERTEELITANRTLKENERLRSTFVSSLTHDLRTPLIAQKRLIELLCEQCPEETGNRVHFLSQGLLQNNENLLEMVSKLLETYQYAEGKILLQADWFDLRLLIEECYDTLREIAKSKEIKLVNRVSKKLTEIYADRSQMKRVLLNLLSNAIENISRSCTVQITGKSLQDTVRIEVSDNGLGIEPEFLPDMFERYSPRSRRRHKLGSGLGLFICKTIVELHHGTIAVSSQLGHGATFTIDLPQLKQHPKTSKTIEEKQMEH